MSPEPGCIFCGGDFWCQAMRTRAVNELGDVFESQFSSEEQESAFTFRH